MSQQYQTIAESFSRSARVYDQAASVQQRSGYRLLDTLNKYVSTSVNTIADIGCGTGFFAREIHQRYQPQYYIGVDIAQGMLDVAKHNNANLNNTLWVCNDAETLALPEQSVDIIYANFSLQWCDDISKVLHNFSRLLKPNGVCCFTSLGENTLYEIRQAWLKVDSLNHVNHFYNVNAWQTAIDKSDFSVIDTYQCNEVAYFVTVDAALRALKKVGANVLKQKHRTSLTGKQRFKHFVQAYESFRETDGIPASYEITGWVLKK